MPAFRLLACALPLLLAPASAARGALRREHAAGQATEAAKGASSVKGRQLPDDTSEDEYEYGDRESQVSHGDSSDFSVHQFLADDDARDVSSSVDTDDTRTSMARSKAMAADDHFNSEDTPDSSDSFAQTGRQARSASRHAAAGGRKKQSPGGDGDEYEYGDRESEVSHSDAADFSVHQFLVDDDARDAAPSTDSESTQESMARSKAMAADDHFNSEDTPDSSDSFAQTGRHKSRKAKQMPDDDGQDEYEYGDREAQVSNADASDFSVHQFLADDDARDAGSDAVSDDPRMSMARAKAMEADDHFNSEDTPDNTDSFAQTARRLQKGSPGLSRGRGPAGPSAQ